MVNRLSKIGHFVVVKSTNLASKVPQIFIRKIMRLHDFPRKIILDRDAKITSRF